MDIFFNPNTIGPVKPAEGEGDAKPASPAPVKAGDFAAILREAHTGQPVRFSAHAKNRLSSRGIEPGPEVLTKLESAVDKAAAKGSRDSLVLIDSLAFVVAVGNRTVVTAFGLDQLKEDIVTNIDSAVIF